MRASEPGPARRRRRWTWEHLLLAWLLAAGAAVASTLVRFPPGEPVRPLRPPPSRLLGPYGGRVALALLRRERVLVAGWVASPLAAALLTAAWGAARLRDRRQAPPGRA